VGAQSPTEGHLIKCSRRVAHKTRKEGAFSARVLAHNSRKRSLNPAEIVIVIVVVAFLMITLIQNKHKKG
jgi:hypothetical protein